MHKPISSSLNIFNQHNQTSLASSFRAYFEILARFENAGVEPWLIFSYNKSIFQLANMHALENFGSSIDLTASRCMRWSNNLISGNIYIYKILFPWVR